MVRLIKYMLYMVCRFLFFVNVMIVRVFLDIVRIIKIVNRMFRGMVIYKENNLILFLLFLVVFVELIMVFFIKDFILKCYFLGFLFV